MSFSSFVRLDWSLAKGPFAALFGRLIPTNSQQAWIDDHSYLLSQFIIIALDTKTHSANLWVHTEMRIYIFNYQPGQRAIASNTHTDNTQCNILMFTKPNNGALYPDPGPSKKLLLPKYILIIYEHAWRLNRCNLIAFSKIWKYPLTHSPTHPQE